METILVVEDEGAIATMLVMLLELEGYTVIRARDGLEALERLAERAPDLILCDVMMPRMGGLEFVTALRTQQPPSTVPVVMMSAGIDSIAAFDGMVSGFLRKPFKIDLLLATVRSILDPPGAAARTT